ncbi:DUF1196 domain-containing protein [Vibrio cholerae]|nr:DUF1196 domain-containing protein [Vibrio cholerae]
MAVPLEAFVMCLFLFLRVFLWTQCEP